MKLIVLIPVIVGVLAVGAVGTVIGLLGSQTWNPSWNPFQEIGAESIEEAIINLLDTETYKYEGDFSVAVKEKGEFIPKKIFSAILNITGKVSNLTAENPEIATNVNLDISGQYVETSSLAAEARAAEGDFYLKVGSLSGSLSKGAPEGLEGQWLKVDIRDEEMSRIAQFLDLPKLSGIITDLKTFLEDKELLTVEEHIGQEKVNGDKADHYLVSINKEALKAAIPEILELIKKYIPEEEKGYEESMEEIMEELPPVIDEVWEKIGGISFEVWVTRKGGRLNRIQLIKEITQEQVTGYGDERVVIEIDLKFSDFNKKVDIAVPEDYGDFEEFFIAPARTKARDARIISALAQSRTVMVYINANEGSYDNFNCQHQDMKFLCDEISAQGGAVKIAKDTLSNSQAACIYALLTQKENYWYCADSGGAAGFTVINPGETGYCLDGKTASCPPLE